MKHIKAYRNIYCTFIVHFSSKKMKHLVFVRDTVNKAMI